MVAYRIICSEIFLHFIAHQNYMISNCLYLIPSFLIPLHSFSLSLIASILLLLSLTLHLLFLSFIASFILFFFFFSPSTFVNSSFLSLAPFFFFSPFSLTFWIPYLTVCLPHLKSEPSHQSISKRNRVFPASGPSYGLQMHLKPSVAIEK